MNSKNLKRITRCLIFLFSCTPLLAKARKIAITDPEGIGAPITAFTAESLAKESWGVSQRSEYYRNRPFSKEALIKNLQAESQTGMFLNYLMFSYGLSDMLTLGAAYLIFTPRIFKPATSIHLSLEKQST